MIIAYERELILKSARKKINILTEKFSPKCQVVKVSELFLTYSKNQNTLV